MSAAVDTYRVQREKYVELREQIHTFLSRVPKSGISAERCDWLYERNPSGSAALWTLRRGDDLVGYTVAIPRPIVINGQELRGWIGADFFIDPTCRTLGPALKLRRAARDAIEAGEADLLYSFPNTRMTSIHERVGHVRLGALERLVLPLRAEHQVQRRLGNSRWVTSVSRLGNMALLLRQLSTRRRAVSCVSWNAEPMFDQRYDELFARAVNQHEIVGMRGSAYLQWRFSENPHYRSSIVNASSGDRLMGYLVQSREGDTVHIRDLFVDASPAITRDLITAVVREAVRTGASSVTMSSMHSAPQYDCLAQLGFLTRDASDSVFVHARSGTVANRAQERHGWHLVLGDRDV